jgi:hypothetical protein
VQKNTEIYIITSLLRKHSELACLNYSLTSIGILNDPNSVRKRCISGSIRMENTSRTVGKSDFLASIGVMIFDLLVRKMIRLHSILMGHLGGLLEGGKQEFSSSKPSSFSKA